MENMVNTLSMDKVALIALALALGNGNIMEKSKTKLTKL